MIWNRIVGITLVALGILAMVGLIRFRPDQSHVPAHQPVGSVTTETPKAEPTPPPMPQELGNGVVYFNVTGKQYTKALVEFYGREKNANLRCDLQGIQYTSINYPTDSTYVTGFILHCTDTASHAQELTVP